MQTEYQGRTAPGLLIAGPAVEREPDAVARVLCENGHLAGFLALRRAPICLAMAVLHGNSRHQLIERVFAAMGAEPDTAVFASRATGGSLPPVLPLSQPRGE